MMTSKPRKYYTPGTNGQAATRKKGYMVRWWCEEEKRTLAEGPFRDKKKAESEQNTKLLAGICSWLVSYVD